MLCNGSDEEIVLNIQNENLSLSDDDDNDNDDESKNQPFEAKEMSTRSAAVRADSSSRE